jgi:hypothetical protein
MGMYDTETRNSMMSGHHKKYEAVNTLAFTDINLFCLGNSVTRYKTIGEKVAAVIHCTMSEYGM